LVSLESMTSHYIIAWFHVLFSDLDYWMKKLVAYCLSTKSHFLKFLLQTSDCESSLYFNLWCLNLISWNGGLINLGGGLAFMVDICSFDYCWSYFLETNYTNLFALGLVFTWNYNLVHQAFFLWVIAHLHHLGNHYQV